MKKSGVLLVLLLTASLFLAVGISSADRLELLHYEDTGLVSLGDVSIDYWYPPDEIEAGSLIHNGDFSNWTDGTPDNWTIWADTKAGWEEAHLSQIDFSTRPEGFNDAMGFFVRNIGGDGHFHAGAWQPLTDVTEPGHYWVTTHMTMWGEEIFGAKYNAVGWYGIGNSEDPGSVADWHELSPLPIPCPNALGACLYMGRYETIAIKPGQVFHLRVGHQFPVYNAWTVFALDDISIVPASGAVIEDGFWPDGLVTWDPRELR